MHEAVLAWDEYIDHIANSDLAQRVSRQIAGAAKAVRTSMSNARGDDEVVRLRGELASVESQYASLPEKTSGISASHEALILRRIQLVQQLNKITGEYSKGDASENASAIQIAERRNEITKELIENFEEAASGCEFSQFCDIGKVLELFNGEIA